MASLDIFLLSFLVVIFTVPMMKKIAVTTKFLDYPAGRKMHKSPKPMLGGISIYLGFAASIIVFLPLTKEVVTITLLSGLMIVVGLYDDYKKTKHKELSALKKGSMQLVIASLTYFSGISFRSIFLPFNIGVINFPPLIRFLLTVTWIFGIVTIVNCSDGIDGLATSIVFISSVTFFIIMIIRGNFMLAYLCLIISGCSLGYFMYNKFPSTIFMGDSGASFFGYLLAVISLDGMLKQATVATLLMPIICLGIPIFDNIFVIIKRTLRKRPIYVGDRSQIHYRLIDSGLTTRQAWGYITVLCVVLSFLTIILTLSSS